MDVAVGAAFSRFSLSFAFVSFAYASPSRFILPASRRRQRAAEAIVSATRDVRRVFCEFEPRRWRQSFQFLSDAARRGENFLLVTRSRTGRRLYSSRLVRVSAAAAGNLLVLVLLRLCKCCVCGKRDAAR